MSSPKEIDVEHDTLERADTFSPDQLEGGKGTRQSCLRRTLRFLKDVPLGWKIGCGVVVIATILVVSLSLGGDDAYQQVRNAIEQEFTKNKLQNYTTVRGVTEEDYIKLLTDALYRGGEQVDVKLDVSIYMQFCVFNREYKREHDSVAEKERRFLIFRENCRKIMRNNANPKRQFTMDLNVFSDITAEEFMALHKVKFEPKNQSNTDNVTISNVVNSSGRKPSGRTINYRDERVMTPVKDQGFVSSSWAFATIGALEAFLKRNGSRELNLSEQQLIDCVPVNNGNEGGEAYKAYEYLKMHGVTTGQAYPYEKVKGECKPTDKQPKYKITQYGYTEKPDLIDLLDKRGPLTVYVAVNEDWQFYSGGILDSCGDTVNHAVVLVGVKDTRVYPHWVIKNSWGSYWGVNGYASINFGSKQYPNECGMSLAAIYPEEVTPENVQDTTPIQPLMAR